MHALEKPAKITRSIHPLKDINVEFDPSIDKALNARFKFYVKVGENKYAFRDTSNPKRYSLTDRPNFFFLEGQAAEAARLFKVSGYKVELIKEEAVNN